MRMTPRGSDPHYGLAQYEALRQEASAAVRGGHGLTLFLTRGMPAWLAALTALAPPPVPPTRDGSPPSAAGPRGAPGLRRELITVLAGLVLGCTEAEGGR